MNNTNHEDHPRLALNIGSTLSAVLLTITEHVLTPEEATTLCIFSTHQETDAFTLYEKMMMQLVSNHLV